MHLVLAGYVDDLVDHTAVLVGSQEGRHVAHIRISAGICHNLGNISNMFIFSRGSE